METNRDAILEQMAICQGDTEEFIAQRGIYYDENPEDAPIDVPGRGFSRDRFAQPNDALGQLSDWCASPPIFPLSRFCPYLLVSPTGVCRAANPGAVLFRRPSGCLASCPACLPQVR